MLLKAAHEIDTFPDFELAYSRLIQTLLSQ